MSLERSVCAAEKDNYRVNQLEINQLDGAV